MDTTPRKKIVIVGAGPGGLAAGMLLAHRGFDVEILEKDATPGGRSKRLTLGEYTFDTGPTFFMMDFVARRLFAETGRNLDDCVNLVRLSPMYRLLFADKYIDRFDEDDRMAAELARVFPGAEKGLSAFNKREATRLARLYPILSRHNNSWWDALRPSFLRAIPSFAIGQSLFQVLGRYFNNPEARLCFTFQSKYLGMSPWECPGAFAMVPFIEQKYGVYHIVGGLNRLAAAMAQVVLDEGGRIRYGSAVARVLVEQGRATGVVLTSGETILADRVILNADFAYAMQQLVPQQALKKYTTPRLAKKKYSCSTFMLYLGVARQYDLVHHTIAFAKDYKKNVDDIFHGRLTDRDFSVYVRNASRTDASLAPAGKSALYVLVPVPNNQAGIDWVAAAPKLREQTLDILEQRFGMVGIREAIEVEQMISPAEWERDYNVGFGAVFNLGHQLRQMLWLRPHNRFEEIKNVYLVGGGTHPGSGLPTIYESGRIAADLISQEFGKKVSGTFSQPQV